MKFVWGQKPILEEEDIYKILEVKRVKSLINDLNRGIKDYLNDNNIEPDTIKINFKTYQRLKELSVNLYEPYLNCDITNILGLSIVLDDNIRDDSCLIYKDKFVKTVFI